LGTPAARQLTACPPRGGRLRPNTTPRPPPIAPMQTRQGGSRSTLGTAVTDAGATARSLQSGR
jgi:hypothetical protein